MLAELAAANAAYKVIKTTIQNGGEIAQLGKQISAWINGEEVARERVNKKKNSLFGSAKGESDWEEFMHLEKVREQREELREIMQLYGRFGLWKDWQKFQADARKRRAKERSDLKKKRKKILELIAIVLAGIIMISVVGFAAWMLKQGL